MLIDNEVMEDEEFKLEQLKTKTPNAADVLASSKQHQLRKMTLTQFNLSSADWAATTCMTYIESFILKFSFDWSWYAFLRLSVTCPPIAIILSFFINKWLWLLYACNSITNFYDILISILSDLINFDCDSLNYGCPCNHNLNSDQWSCQSEIWEWSKPVRCFPDSIRYCLSLSIATPAPIATPCHLLQRLPHLRCTLAILGWPGRDRQVLSFLISRSTLISFLDFTLKNVHRCGAHKSPTRHRTVVWAISPRESCRS